jgi:hypothetical protein
VFGQVNCFCFSVTRHFYQQAAFNYEFHFLDDTAILVSGIRHIFLEGMTQILVLFIIFCLLVVP